MYLVIDKIDTRTKDLGTDQVTPQKVNLVTPQLTKLADKQYRLLDLCEIPQALTDILAEMGLSNRTYFKQKYINPLITNGLLTMTKPDKPRAKDQKYVVTSEGRQVVLKRRGHDDTNNEAT